MAAIFRHGEPGNPTEETVAKYLSENLPALYQVHYALKMGRDQTDYDCIVVAPHAIYAIEIKAYGESIKFDAHSSQWILSSGEKKPAAVSQAATNRSKLHTLLQDYYIGFKDVPVQEVVCLYAEKKPVLQIPEDQRRLTFWYCDLPAFLQNPKRLIRKWLQVDLTDYIDIVNQALATGFDRPKRIRDYTLESCVWITNQYRAYAASSPNFPNQHLLKVYDFPNDVSEETVRKFINDLARERNALKLAAERGNPASGGKDYVIVFDEAFYFKARNQYVVVMNWFKGELLSTLMRHYDKVPRKERFSMAAQMCRGLQFVHSAGIIHRGLHPENIVRGKDGSIKLVNFNFAKFTNPPTLTGFETMRPDNFLLNRWIKDSEKTHRYIAPELWSKEQAGKNSLGTFYSKATRETDLFSLGVILWELFAEEIYPGPQAESLDQKANLAPEIAIPLRQMVASEVVERRKVDLLDVAGIFEHLASGEPLDNRSLPALKPKQKFEGFEIEKELATTLMSRTYQAKDKFGDGHVVIKFLRSSGPNSALGEMDRAWNILNHLDAAYTARLRGGGQVYVHNGKIQESENGAQIVYYQVFEFLQGKTLRELIQDGSIRADQQQLKLLILGVLEAVRAVHQANWIHQDIKPDNFILTEEGRVKIIDFGLSQRVNSANDMEAYSPGYTPPEVRRTEHGPGKPWTQAGDVYSAAYVIVALICGEPELKGPVLDARQIQAVGGSELLDLLQKDTSNDPADRLPSAIVMVEKYQPVIENFHPTSPENPVLPDSTREPTMDEIKVREWIDELQKRAKDSKDQAEFDLLGDAAEHLHHWLEHGMPGDCPVDLSAFEPKQPAAQRDAEPEEISPSSAAAGREIVPVSTELPAASVTSTPVGAAFNDQELPSSNPISEPISSSPPGSDISEAERGSRVARLVARGEQEMQKIENAVEGADFGRIYDVITELRRLDPNGIDAFNLERELAVYEHRDELRRLKKKLSEIEDPGPLNNCINQAKQLIHEAKGDPELQELIDKAIVRRDTIRQAMGQLTTIDALKYLEGVNKVLVELEVSRQRGFTTFYDERSKQDRPLQDFLSDMRQKQANLAAEVAAHNETRARSYMPEDGIRNPKTAVPLLQEAAALEGQSKENRERLQELLVDWQDQARKWEEADGLLRQADEATDSLVKLNLARRAREAYPYHKQTRNLIALMSSACSLLKEKLRQAIEKGESELRKAPAEAERLRRENSAQPLQAFMAARQPVNEVMLNISELRQEEQTEELKAQLELAHEFLSKVRNRENRRQEIAAAYNRIHADLDRGDKDSSLKAYEKLSEDFIIDPEIRYLREQMDKFFGIDELVQEARRHYRARMWEDVLKTCEKIEQFPKVERQPFQAELGQMRAEASLYTYEQGIRQSLEGAYYDQAAEFIRKFDLVHYEPEPGQQDLKQALAGVLNLEAVRADLHNRTVVDRQLNIRQQWQTLQRELLRQEAALEKLKLGSPEIEVSEAELDRAIQIYDRLNDLRVAESSYKGVLRDAFARAQTMLHDLLLHELRRQHSLYLQASDPEKQQFDYRPAYRMASTLVEKQLTYTQDSELRRWALLGYFDQQDREVSDLEQKVKNWEAAYGQFPEPVFRRRMREVQMAYLVHILDQCLRAQDYPRVEKLLSGAEVLPVYNKPFNYDQHDEPVLQIRKQFAEIQKQNLALEARADYFGIVQNYQGLLKSLDVPDRALVGNLKSIAENQRKQSIEESVNKLLEKGDRLSNAPGNEHDIPAAMGAYAAALQLNPEHLRVRTIIENNAGQIMVESDNAIQKAQSARGNVGQENLAGRIDEYRILANRLRGLAAACTQLGNHEKAGSLKRVLEGGTDNLLKVLREMEDCQRILIAIDPAGHIWKNKCLAEGKWEEAHKFLKQLSESILGGGHEAVVELSERINTHTAVRRALNDLKEDIRSALSGDDFEQGQALCDELDTALQNNMELNGVAFQFPPFDPYQIVQKDWREFDLFSRKRIPYFGATPDPPMPPEPDFERMIIRQVFQTRQENLKNWERVHQDILREHHRLVEAAGSVEEIRPRRQPSHPTRGQLDKVIAYENDCKTTHGHCEAKVATVPEPLSRKAESLQRTCKRLVDEIKDQQGFATKDRLSLEADEQKVQQEIDLAVEALEKKQDGKATGYISAADEFYEDSPDNPNRDFIKHLSDILIETPQEK